MKLSIVKTMACIYNRRREKTATAVLTARDARRKRVATSLPDTKNNGREYLSAGEWSRDFIARMRQNDTRAARSELLPALLPFYFVRLPAKVTHLHQSDLFSPFLSIILSNFSHRRSLLPLMLARMPVSIESFQREANAEIYAGGAR